MSPPWTWSRDVWEGSPLWTRPWGRRSCLRRGRGHGTFGRARRCGRGRGDGGGVAAVVEAAGMRGRGRRRGRGRGDVRVVCRGRGRAQRSALRHLRARRREEKVSPSRRRRYLFLLLRGEGDLLLLSPSRRRRYLFLFSFFDKKAISSSSSFEEKEISISYLLRGEGDLRLRQEELGNRGRDPEGGVAGMDARGDAAPQAPFQVVAAVDCRSDVPMPPDVRCFVVFLFKLLNEIRKV